MKKLIAWLLVLGVLAACTPATPEVIEKEVIVEKPVVETVIVEKEVVVEKPVVETVEVSKEVAVPVEKRLVIYNSMHGDPVPREADPHCSSVATVPPSPGHPPGRGTSSRSDTLGGPGH